MVPSKISFPMLYILRISPLEGTYWRFGQWLCRWCLQTLTLLKTKTHSFQGNPVLWDKRPFLMTLLVHFYFSYQERSFSLVHTELSNKGDRKKMKKENKIHWLDFLKVCWYRTCRRRTANVYPLFKAFRLQKYHVQDAWNCITCLRIRVSKTLPLSLSQNRIRLTALVCFT